MLLVRKCVIPTIFKAVRVSQEVLWTYSLQWILTKQETRWADSVILNLQAARNSLKTSHLMWFAQHSSCCELHTSHIMMINDNYLICLLGQQSILAATKTQNPNFFIFFLYELIPIPWHCCCQFSCCWQEVLVTSLWTRILMKFGQLVHCLTPQ